MGIASGLTTLSFASSLLGFAPIILLGVLVIVVVSNRAEPDPSGRRPFAVYYFAISFVAVFTLLFATEVVVSSLMSLAGSDGASGDSVARSVVLGLLAAIFAGLVLAIHVQRGLALARLGNGPLDPTLRVAQTYVAAVSFLVVLIGLVAAVAAVYSIFGAPGPGVFNPSGSRSSSLRGLVDTLYLVGASWLILSAHLRLAPPYLRPFGGVIWLKKPAGSRGVAAAAAAAAADHSAYQPPPGPGDIRSAGAGVWSGEEPGENDSTDVETLPPS
jgi:hypothetical protein